MATTRDEKPGTEMITPKVQIDQEGTSMNQDTPPFLLDPTIHPSDRSRIAYAQDSFFTRVMDYNSNIICCRGPINDKDICTICHAPTTAIPHAVLDDQIHFSSSYGSLVFLLHDLLRSWSAEDLRLLGGIMREDDPLLITQDIIHVYQRRHPLGIAWFRWNHSSPWTPFDEYVEELAPDVFFVPMESDFADPPQAGLFIGLVRARLSLSPETLKKGHKEIDEQWVTFLPDCVHLPFAEHPRWQQAFDQTLQDYRTYVQQARLDDPTDYGDETEFFDESLFDPPAPRARFHSRMFAHLGHVLRKGILACRH